MISAPSVLRLTGDRRLSTAKSWAAITRATRNKNFGCPSRKAEIVKATSMPADAAPIPAAAVREPLIVIEPRSSTSGRRFQLRKSWAGVRSSNLSALARANSHGLDRVVAVTEPVPARLRGLRVTARVGGARADPNFARSLDTRHQPPTRPGVASRLSEEFGLGPVSVADRKIDSNDRTASGPGQTLDGQVAIIDGRALFGIGDQSAHTHNADG